MQKNSKLDDQIPLNNFLVHQKSNIKWKFLPDEFFNGGLYTGKIWQPGDEIQIPKNVIIHHACFTVGIENKIKQLNYVKNKVEPSNGPMKIFEYFIDLFDKEQIKTEYTAYELLKRNLILKNINYLAVPWSVLINENKLDQFPNIKLDGGFTICQHVYYEKIIPILKKIGINVLFTPHVNKNYNGIKVLPFPHLAVNSKKNLVSKDIYYSFIGFNTNKTRVKIFKMKHPSKAKVIERKQWHFNQKSTQKLNEKNEYENVLQRSRFSLCPRGVGASTLRFWESLKAGAIPVLIADDMILPEYFDWSKCIVRIKENQITQINSILTRINKNKEEQMRNNSLIAYSLFSDENFVKCIRDHYFLND